MKLLSRHALRDVVQHGFEMLNRLVPSLIQVSSGKINKATTLEKSELEELFLTVSCLCHHFIVTALIVVASFIHICSHVAVILYLKNGGHSSFFLD